MWFSSFPRSPFTFVLLLLLLIQLCPCRLSAESRESLGNYPPLLPAPSYLERIKRLREEALSTVRIRAEDSDPTNNDGVKRKPRKRYKCVLVEVDDDGEEESGWQMVALPSSTVSEVLPNETVRNGAPMSSGSSVNAPATNMRRVELLPVARPVSTANHKLDIGGEMISGVVFQPLPSASPPGAAAPPSTATFSDDISRDSHGRPLVLPTEYCGMVYCGAEWREAFETLCADLKVDRYASAYQVRNTTAWVESNCNVAKIFLPSATCEEISALIGSCYKGKKV